MKKILIGIGIIVLIAGLAFYIISKPGPALGLESWETPNYAGDLFGTKIGTTTTGVLFGGSFTATSTKVVKLGNNYDQATVTVMPRRASSSAALRFSIYGSNDFSCDTATTSADYGDPVLMQEINWFDLGINTRELAGSQTIGAATSTWEWTGVKQGLGRVIVLKDLSYECLKVEANGSSTELWAQLKLK